MLLFYCFREDVFVQLPHDAADAFVVGINDSLRLYIGRLVLMQAELIHKHTLYGLRAA